jgi:hypothetical protein
MVLWVAIPAGWLWVASQASSDYVTVYGLALVGAPLSMVLWAWLLYRLNAVYLRVIGAPPRPRRQSAWLQSISSERRWRQPDALIEVSMAISVTTAIVLFTIWFLFFAGSSIAPYG